MCILKLEVLTSVAKRTFFLLDMSIKKQQRITNLFTVHKGFLPGFHPELPNMMSQGYFGMLAVVYTVAMLCTEVIFL